MRLYYAPGTCALSVHIVLREIGASFDLVEVDLATKRTDGGDDFKRIHSLGLVPALVLDDGEILVETPAILQYLADQRPETGLAPPAGTMERVRLQSFLNFTAAELHRSFTPFFARPRPEGAAREAALAKLAQRFDFVEASLAKSQPYLLGPTFTVADAYTFVVATWGTLVDISIEPWPRVVDYVARISARPHVGAAIEREGPAV